jgi:hypothetical protein
MVPKHEKAMLKKADDKGQKHHVIQKEFKASSKQLYGGRQEGFFAIGKTFQPDIEKHLEMLNNMDSDTERSGVLLQLQQSYGNRYVQRLVQMTGVQTKLSVSQPDDVYEQEADRVAGTVVRNIHAPLSRQEEEEEVQTQPEEEELQTKASPVLRQSEEEEEVQTQPEEEELQTKASPVLRQSEEEEEVQTQPEEEELQTTPVGKSSVLISESLENRIKARRGNGHPLSEVVRKPMEKAFGADFNEVHVHTDSEADTLNRDLRARAFTTGQDIFFRQGEYSPGSSSGQELIAHELTHVVQQNGNKIKRKGKINRKTNTKGKFNITRDTKDTLIREKDTPEPEKLSLPKPETGPIAPTVPPRAMTPTRPTGRAIPPKPTKPLPPVPSRERPELPERPLTPALKRKITIVTNQLIDKRVDDIRAKVDQLPPKSQVDEGISRGKELQEDANHDVEQQKGSVRELIPKLIDEDVPQVETVAPAGGETSDIAGKLAEGRDWVHTAADYVMEGLQAGMVGSQKVLNILGHISGAIGIFFTTIMSYLDIRAILRTGKRMKDLDAIDKAATDRVRAKGIGVDVEELEFVNAIRYAYNQKLVKIIRRALTLFAGLTAAGVGIAFWAAGGIAAAANAWNPVGWGIALGLAMTGALIGIGILGHKIFNWWRKRKTRGQERTRWATKIFEQGIDPGGRLKGEAQRAINSLKIRRASGLAGTLKSFFWKGKGDVITANEMDRAYKAAKNKDRAKARFVKGIAGKLSST